MIFASIYDYITDFYYLCSANYNTLNAMISFLAYGMVFLILLAITALIGFGKLCGYIHDQIERRREYNDFFDKHPELNRMDYDVDEIDWCLLKWNYDDMEKTNHRTEQPSIPKQVKCTNRYQEFQRRFPKFTGKFWSESEGNWEEVLKHAEMMDIIESSQQTK